MIDVGITKSGNGWIIRIVDENSDNSLAITREELEKIVDIGTDIISLQG